MRLQNVAVIAIAAGMAATAVFFIGAGIYDSFTPEPAGPAQTADGKPCVTDDAGFWTQDGAHTFKVKLTNACEVRQRCTVNVYIVNSQGPQQGTGTLTLAPKSKGADSEQSYVMKVAQAGGMANVSRQCR
jgi:hypothetical protein